MLLIFNNEQAFLPLSHKQFICMWNEQQGFAVRICKLDPICSEMCTETLKMIFLKKYFTQNENYGIIN